MCFFHATHSLLHVFYTQLFTSPFYKLVFYRERSLLPPPPGPPTYWYFLRLSFFTREGSSFSFTGEGKRTCNIFSPFPHPSWTIAHVSLQCFVQSADKFRSFLYTLYKRNILGGGDSALSLPVVFLHVRFFTSSFFTESTLSSGPSNPLVVFFTLEFFYTTRFFLSHSGFIIHFLSHLE